ncbi:MAG TPA: hypothetical protein VFA20_24165 [Myxococcaceae bacterium]|nr:hypothetical protein [Myxococcaceae bacterium]
MKVSPWWVVGALAAFAGCRDLSVPSNPPGSGSGGPEVGFLVPDVDLAQISVNPDVELTAADVTGVAQVELRCAAPGGVGGQVQVRVWTAAPYRGTVDLTACKPLGVDQGNGTLEVALVVHAQDRQGNPSNPDAVREVVIDPDVAVLTTTAPPRAAPSAALSFTVTSDRDLQGAPQVLLGETVATVTGGPRVFNVSFAQTPAIGIDAYAGPQPPPLEVLEDVDHPVVLSIQGRTLTGNLSQLNVSMVLSRLRWSRGIPNAVLRPGPESGSWPVAIPGGIQVPLSTGSGWLPGFFSRQDGTYTPFPASALGDAGFVFRGFDGQGNALANHFDRNLNKVMTRFFAPGSPVPLGPDAPSSLRSSNDVGAGTALPLARLDHGLCEASAQGCPALNEINCVSPSGPTSVPLAATPSDTLAPSAGVGSGDVYLGINLPFSFVGCGPQVSLEWELGSGATLKPGPDTTNSGATVEWALPAGDGTFVVSQADGGTSEAFLLQSNGVPGPVYFSGTGAHALFADQLMVARKDHAVAVFKGFSDHSEFELYGPQPAGSPGTGLIARSSIPARLAVADGGVSPQSLAGANRVDAVALPDGKIAMAFGLAPNGLFFVVVVFDAGMQPRWMYRIPEPVFSQGPLLVGTGDTVYFVDTQGQLLHAFTP